MGTRSLTFVYTGQVGSEPLINIYRQFDGYPSGHGAELADFLTSFDEIVNGIPVGDKRKLANGMGCLAAQLVGQLKDGVGNVYLYPLDARDCWQEYEYHIYENRIVVKNPGEVIFDGSWQEFYEFCHAKENA